MGPKKAAAPKMEAKRDAGKEKKQRADWTEEATRALVDARLERHDRFNAKARVQPLWMEIAALLVSKYGYVLSRSSDWLGSLSLHCVGTKSITGSAAQNGK